MSILDPVERFAAEAARFREWALHGIVPGERGARAALLHVTRLYLAALELPPAPDEDMAAPTDAEVVDGESRAVYDACARLPLDPYGEVFDPLPVPPEEPVVGSLADDIADVYRDVVSGLVEHRAGRPAQALLRWEITFSHWGEHLTSAIRALHCWIVANARDRARPDHR
jgi:hypothetical protein